MDKGGKVTSYIAAICASKDIRYAVISPGSRSAPLALAFARNPNIQCLPVIDERSAAYFAMGIALQTELPVAVICTSGTAALNLAPAIAEAFYQRIPMLVFTADRPVEWIGQQDGQSVQQQRMYQNFVMRSYHLQGETWLMDDLWYVQRCVNESIDISMEQRGPVHINIAFREPLYDIPEVDPSLLRITRTSTTQIYPVSSESIQAATRLACTFSRVMIVIGQLQADDELEVVLNALSQFPNVVVIKESLCNIDIPNAVNNVNETVAAFEGESNYAPELVISFGGAIVSKRLKQFLRNSNTEHWHITPDDSYMDVFQRLTRQFKCNIYTFIFSLTAALKKNHQQSSFQQKWKEASKKTILNIGRYTADVTFSDWTVYSWILSQIPSGSHLHLGNSTPVRYGQIFAHHCEDIQVYSNRGTSGIDGCLSTAAGSAYASGQLTFCILGDLSFQYDANALWNQHLSSNLKIIVVNNSGGNIFRLIEGSSCCAELETFFETRTNHNFEHLCEHFNMQYFKADSMGSMENQWMQFLNYKDRPAVIEIKTDPVVSEKVFKEYYIK